MPFDHFLAEQDRCLAAVLRELDAGAKQTHWMWFVFPQLAGLGASATAARFALAGLDEARAFAAHPVLGPRLVDCTRRVLAVERRSLRDIFGPPDDLKFVSCMTLFARAVPGQGCFQQALDRFHAGLPDPGTMHLLARGTRA